MCFGCWCIGFVFLVLILCLIKFVCFWLVFFLVKRFICLSRNEFVCFFCFGERLLVLFNRVWMWLGRFVFFVDLLLFVGSVVLIGLNILVMVFLYIIKGFLWRFISFKGIELLWFVDIIDLYIIDFVFWLKFWYGFMILYYGSGFLYFKGSIWLKMICLFLFGMIDVFWIEIL